MEPAGFTGDQMHGARCAQGLMEAAAGRFQMPVCVCQRLGPRPGLAQAPGPLPAGGAAAGTFLPLVIPDPGQK